MVEAFWKEIGESLAGKWAARALAPAFAFWAGGLLAYVHKHGWKCLADWWAARSTPEQAAVLIGGLLGIVFSGLVMEWFQDVVLRWAEGYWPRPLDWLRFALARRWEKRVRQMEERWQALAERCEGDPVRLPPREQAEYARLDSGRGADPPPGRPRSPDAHAGGQPPAGGGGVSPGPVRAGGGGLLAPAVVLAAQGGAGGDRRRPGAAGRSDPALCLGAALRRLGGVGVVGHPCRGGRGPARLPGDG
ncbi:MAG TPA: hypothetical protein ENK56_04835, partial [Chloroflexi bacterium]|nr:hypothetical protein [Chloroflexota bacterium]